ncbi:MAG: gliding motility lipoprotein GldB [Bacteroidota bacterium]
MKNTVLYFLISILIVAGCNNDKTEKCAFRPDTDDIKIDLQWESLEDSLPSITNEQQLKRFLNKHADVRELFFGRSEYPSDSLFTKSLMDRFTSPYMDTLVTDTHRVFGDGSKLKEEFTKAFANFKYYYPDFQPPKIKTMISGLEADVYVSDTLVIIGLDYFIGPTRKYQIQNIPYEYITRRYQPGYIVPSVMLLFGIDSKYNKVNQQDRTMLADMISYGKAYYFAKQMSPCTPDSVLIGYTSREINGSRANESLIWSRLVEDQVLFSTSGVDRQNYINERPKTLEVGPECPGRIGRWVGWRIVETYHEDHPDQSLKQIMENSDAQKMFKESGYKPSLTKVPSRQKI